MWWIINDYITVFKTKIDKNLLMPPVKWKSGSKGSIVLIPGWNSRWRSMNYVGNGLNQLGYSIHTIDGLGKNHYSLKDSVGIVSRYIIENDLRDVFLIGHSKGGLIAACVLGQMQDRISKVFSISCPWGGSMLGYFYFLGLIELIPQSRPIKYIINNVNLKKIVNLYPMLDNHVIPNKNLILKGAKNVLINTKGHTTILFSKKMMEIIREEILL